MTHLSNIIMINIPVRSMDLEWKLQLKESAGENLVLI